MLRFIMLGLSFLMISNVQYAAMPTIGYRSVRQVLGSLLVLGTIFGVIFLPKEFFFPAAMAYVLYGLVATVFIGLLDRLPAGADEASKDLVPRDFPHGEGADLVTGVLDERTTADGRRRRRRRRHRGVRPDGAPPRATTRPPTPNPDEDSRG
jgi:hypothetical protein